MQSKSKLALLVLLVFVAGAAVPAFLIWNPVHWEWADSLVGRDQASTEATAQAEGTAGERKILYWRAPMDPNYISDQPGKSPMGMDLIPVYADEQSPSATQTEGSSGERKIKYWRAPMDPNYISDKPGKSPMGMDLVPVYEDEAAASSSGGVRVDPGFLQNFAVKTATVEQGNIPIQVRTVGLLTYNEKSIASVNTKFEGWIETAYVNYVGEHVDKGQVLFEIYSPQLVTTEQEYLAALDYVHQLESRAEPDAVARARSLLAASRERLRYWDITEDQIDQLRESGQVARTLKIYSPVSGYVVKKMDRSLEGMKLTPGMNVFQIADLSTIWAEVEIYEYQLQHVRLGQSAQITVDAFPGRQWTGKIIYMDPSVNPKTRTLKAFVEIRNPRDELRPEMYVNVAMDTPGVSNAVKVPEQAVIHTGERSVVIVQQAKGVFDPREVKLGTAGAGYEEVLSGLRAGETIVTSSQFLIDSESNLKAAINQMLAERSGSSDQQPSEAEPSSQQQ